MEGQINSIIQDLGSNYQGDIDVIEAIYKDISSIASNISNIEASNEKLYPYIKKTVKAVYLSRGAEGLKSRGEGSITSSYEVIIEQLRNDLVQSGLRRAF